MKKSIFVFVALMFSALVGFTSCNSCGSKVEKEATETDTISGLVLEQVVSLDRETMYTQYSQDYVWYETQMILKDFLDGECDGKIESITNVFQIFDKETGEDPKVVMFIHTEDSTKINVVDGFWCEDLIMNDQAFNLTFTDAFEKVMSADIIKPHSRCCTLRRELGPKLVNPQYIFGNMKAQIYVDATTGNLTDKDPAFEGFTKPE